MNEYHEFKKKALENLFIAIGYGIIAFSKKKQEEKNLEPKIQAKQKPQTRPCHTPPQPIPEPKQPENFESMP